MEQVLIPHLKLLNLTLSGSNRGIESQKQAILKSMLINEQKNTKTEISDEPKTPSTMSIELIGVSNFLCLNHTLPLLKLIFNIIF